MPVAGKTGDLNGYRNAAFAGFVPKASETGWHWAEGFTIVSYVGNDGQHTDETTLGPAPGVATAHSRHGSTAQAMADAGLLVPPVNEAEWTVPRDTRRFLWPEGTGSPLAVAPEEPGRTVLVEGLEGTPCAASRRLASMSRRRPR